MQLRFRLKAILQTQSAKNGLPLSWLKTKVSSVGHDPWIGDFEELAFRSSKQIDDLIEANVADSGRLFVDLHSFAKPPLKREFKVSYSVQGTDTATGEMFWKTGPAERPATISEEVTFRRIDGLWYFGLNDEGVALFEKIDAQEKD